MIMSKTGFLKVTIFIILQIRLSNTNLHTLRPNKHKDYPKLGLRGGLVKRPRDNNYQEHRLQVDNYRSKFGKELNENKKNSYVNNDNNFNKGSQNSHKSIYHSGRYSTEDKTHHGNYNYAAKHNTDSKNNEKSIHSDMRDNIEERKPKDDEHKTFRGKSKFEDSMNKKVGNREKDYDQKYDTRGKSQATVSNKPSPDDDNIHNTESNEASYNDNYAQKGDAVSFEDISNASRENDSGKSNYYYNNDEENNQAFSNFDYEKDISRNGKTISDDYVNADNASDANYGLSEINSEVDFNTNENSSILYNDYVQNNSQESNLEARVQFSKVDNPQSDVKDKRSDPNVNPKVSSFDSKVENSNDFLMEGDESNFNSTLKVVHLNDDINTYERHALNHSDNDKASNNNKKGSDSEFEKVNFNTSNKASSNKNENITYENSKKINDHEKSNNNNENAGYSNIKKTNYRKSEKVSSNKNEKRSHNYVKRATNGNKKKVYNKTKNLSYNNSEKSSNKKKTTNIDDDKTSFDNNENSNENDHYHNSKSVDKESVETTITTKIYAKKHNGGVDDTKSIAVKKNITRNGNTSSYDNVKDDSGIQNKSNNDHGTDNSKDVSESDDDISKDDDKKSVSNVHGSTRNYYLSKESEIDNGGDKSEVYDNAPTIDLISNETQSSGKGVLSKSNVDKKEVDKGEEDKYEKTDDNNKGNKIIRQGITIGNNDTDNITVQDDNVNDFEKPTASNLEEKVQSIAVEKNITRNGNTSSYDNVTEDSGLQNKSNNDHDIDNSKDLSESEDDISKDDDKKSVSNMHGSTRNYYSTRYSLPNAGNKLDVNKNASIIDLISNETQSAGEGVLGNSVADKKEDKGGVEKYENTVDNDKGNKIIREGDTIKNNDTFEKPTASNSKEKVQENFIFLVVPETENKNPNELKQSLLNVIKNIASQSDHIERKSFDSVDLNKMILKTPPEILDSLKRSESVVDYIKKVDKYIKNRSPQHHLYHHNEVTKSSPDHVPTRNHNEEKQPVDEEQFDFTLNSRKQNNDRMSILRRPENIIEYINKLDSYLRSSSYDFKERAGKLADLSEEIIPNDKILLENHNGNIFVLRSDTKTEKEIKDKEREREIKKRNQRFKDRKKRIKEAKQKAVHEAELKRVMDYLRPNQITTHYVYNEVMRMKKTTMIRDKLRKMVWVMETPNYRSQKLDQAVLKCFHTAVKEMSKSNFVEGGVLKDNRHVIHIVEDQINDGVY